MLRVTSQSIANQAIENIQLASERLAKAQEVATTGRRINQISDDPIGSVRVLRLRGFGSSLEQFKRNIDHAQPFLEQTDSTLSNVTDGINRAKELALSMANDTVTASDRQAAAAELHQIYLNLLSQANTKVENQYIFGGFATDAQPFAAGANGVDYLGDNGRISVASGSTSLLQTNLLGNQVFQGVGVTNGVGILDTLRDLETVLQGQAAQPSLSLKVNLDSGTASGAGFSFPDAVGTEAPAAAFRGEADFSADVTVFDSVGQAHTVTFLFAKTGASFYKYRVVANSNEISGGTSGDLYQVATEGTLQFNPDGSLNTGSSTLTNINLANLSDGAANIAVSAVDLSFSGSTQTAAASAVIASAQTNANGIQAQLGRLDAALDQISTFRSDIGARLNSADTARTAVDTLQTQTEAEQSSVEDSDILTAYSEFARLQQAFQAAVASAARMIQPSLLDFLQ
jgi:flagellar hook-associated protein 3 FlgL